MLAAVMRSPRWPKLAQEKGWPRSGAPASLLGAGRRASLGRLRAVAPMRVPDPAGPVAVERGAQRQLPEPEGHEFRSFVFWSDVVC